MAMLSRVRKITVNLDKLEGLREEWPRYPSTLRGKGLHAGYLIVDPETGDGLSITLWDDEEAMRASENSPEFQEAYRRLADFFTEGTCGYFSVICAPD